MLEALAEWKEEDRKGPGGRPETFSTRALLVAIELCALTDQPMHATRFCDIYSRPADDRDADGAITRGKLVWGFEATLVVSGPDDPGADRSFPHLMVGISALFGQPKCQKEPRETNLWRSCRRDGGCSVVSR